MPGKKRHVAPNFSQLKVSSVKARARGLHIKMEGCQRTGYFAELTRQNKSKGKRFTGRQTAGMGIALLVKRGLIVAAEARCWAGRLRRRRRFAPTHRAVEVTSRTKVQEKTQYSSTHDTTGSPQHLSHSACQKLGGPGLPLVAELRADRAAA